MQAGFAKKNINPPIGTRMFGWSQRDAVRGCDGIHDDLFVRALWLSQKEETVLILGYDLLFFSRDIADRLKGAVGRRFGLAPRQVLLNTSHTHNGPATGTWGVVGFSGIDPLYIDEVERASIDAAQCAREKAVPVRLFAGETECDIAINRRTFDEVGEAVWEANPEGPVYRNLPLCLIQDEEGRPVCLLFSTSCHPSIVPGFLISADYPGAAMAEIDAGVGSECSLFLQGVGGETKVKSFSKPNDFGTTWEDVNIAGAKAAQAVMEAVRGGLSPVTPNLAADEVEVELPMTPIPARDYFHSLVESQEMPSDTRLWAERMVEIIDRGMKLPQTVPVTVQGVRLAEYVRLVGIEGEVVAEHGPLVAGFFSSGVTFPLGYANGCQLYIPTTKMLDEGGYEVDSYYEYGWAAPLAPGIEETILDGLQRLRM